MRAMWAAMAVGLVVGGCGDDGASGPAGSDSADTNDVADTGEPNPDSAIDGPDSEVDPEVDALDADVVEDIVVPPPRATGERAPLSARCDDSDPRRCFLPWPSSVFLTRDATLPTGVRVTVATDVLATDEGVERLAGADGFSRVTPIIALLPQDAAADELAGAVLRVFVAEPGEAFANEVPIDPVIVPGRNPGDRASIVGYPLVPLRAASEHLVIVEAPGLRSFEDASATVHAADVALGTAGRHTLSTTSGWAWRFRSTHAYPSGQPVPGKSS